MIRRFTDGDLDAAAEMLAERHARHREKEPLLPADVDFRAQIESEWSVDGASGVISPEGYLFARPLPYGQGDLTWMVAGIGGHAVMGDPEHARDLYAAAASAWESAGHLRHAVFVPAQYGQLVDAWFRLSFGASGVLAMRETVPEPPAAPAVAIRAGSPDDLDARRAARHGDVHVDAAFAELLAAGLVDARAARRGMARHLGGGRVRALRRRARRPCGRAHAALQTAARPPGAEGLDRPGGRVDVSRGARIGRGPAR